MYISVSELLFLFTIGSAAGAALATLWNHRR